MMGYKTFVKSLVIIPVGDTIFSEQATTGWIDDEAAGPFVVVEQEGNVGKVGTISINAKEWPSIRSAIEQQLAICHMIEENERSDQAQPLRTDTDEA
jgi:hypothetical protein